MSLPTVCSIPQRVQMRSAGSVPPVSHLCCFTPLLAMGHGTSRILLDGFPYRGGLHDAAISPGEGVLGLTQLL